MDVLKWALAPMLALSLVAPALAAPSPAAVHGVIVHAIEDYIRPKFDDFAAAAKGLDTAVSALCATPSEATLASSRDSFKTAVLGFSQIEFVRIGPLTQGDRLERLLFWPDRKGIALKQVQSALASQDPTAAKPETLRGKSVAMQGLGALEFLLFGTDADQLSGSAGAYRCAYAGSITSLVAMLSKEIADEWADPAGISQSLMQPSPEAADFRTDTEVLEKLAASLVNGTETIRDQRLTPILGASGLPKPRSALFWRSQMTAPALTANFAGLGEFFNKAGFADALAYVDGWIIVGTKFQTSKAAKAAGLVTSPMDAAVADPVQLGALKDLVTVTASLDELIGTGLSEALGLSVGFSALDGD